MSSRLKQEMCPSRIPLEVHNWLPVRTSARAVVSATSLQNMVISILSLSVGGSVRMILTVPDPDAVFLRAIKAGALEVVPVSEEHGWLVGRVVDPLGHHCGIGRQVAV